MLNDIGVVMIGAGFMGQVHVEALRRVGVDIRGIMGADENESCTAAHRLGLPRGYRSFKEVLEDPGVDSVHLGVPNHLHLPMAREAILAGKHVLCEKPLAMNSAESAELVQLAKDHPNLATGVNYNVRFYPLCHQARAMIRHNEVGRVFHITGSVAQDWLLYDTDFNWRVLADVGGALRAIGDIGSHWMDLIYFITGMEVEELCADHSIVHPIRKRSKVEVQTFSNTAIAEEDTEPVPVNTEDYGCLMMRLKGGAHACLWVSQVSPGHKCSIRFEIAGQETTLEWDSQRCEEMWVGRRNAASSLLQRDPAMLCDEARAVTSYPAGHAEGYPDTFKHAFKAFYERIDKGYFSVKPTYATFQDGHREIVLCEAVLRSFKENGWVKVPEINI